LDQNPCKRGFSLGRATGRFGAQALGGTRGGTRHHHVENIDEEGVPEGGVPLLRLGVGTLAPPPVSYMALPAVLPRPAL
jgi:hypothetical protein